MRLGGDELGRTQRGNNNAWCQDNEISWFDRDGTDEGLHDFTRKLIRLRRDEPVFRRRDFLLGDSSRSGIPDVCWYRPDGEAMTEQHWEQDDARALAVFLNGDEIPTHTRAGERIRGDSFLLLLNGHHEPVEFTIPPAGIGRRRTHELATTGEPSSDEVTAGSRILVDGRSLVVLRRSEEP
jgi:isoamylase